MFVDKQGKEDSYDVQLQNYFTGHLVGESLGYLVGFIWDTHMGVCEQNPLKAVFCVCRRGALPCAGTHRRGRVLGPHLDR